MKKYLKAFVITLCILYSCATTAQSRRALVIGIGDYPAESGWSKINGDRDIDIVCSFLVANGFAQSDIHTLKNAEATKANIIQQFSSITQTAGEGDQIYIHFSGHGQQVTDLDGDEDDGWDEAWIPYDAQKIFQEGVYEGENHIIDDQIYEILKNIQEKIGPTGALVVVVDACHSGDSWRGEEEEEWISRGTKDKFEIPGEAPTVKQIKQPIEWVFISACKSYQINYECKVEDKHYGSLSYSLYALRDKIYNRTLDNVHHLISETMSQLLVRMPPQTIQVEAPDKYNHVYLFGK